MVIGRGLLHIVKVDAVRTVDEGTAARGSKVTSAGVDKDRLEPHRTGEGNGDGELVVDVGLCGGIGRKTLVPRFDDILGGFRRVKVGTPDFVAHDVFEQAGSIAVDG